MCPHFGKSHSWLCPCRRRSLAPARLCPSSITVIKLFHPFRALHHPQEKAWVFKGVSESPTPGSGPFKVTLTSQDCLSGRVKSATAFPTPPDWVTCTGSFVALCLCPHPRPGTPSFYLSQSSPPFEIEFEPLNSTDCFLLIALRAFTVHDDFFFFLVHSV